MKIDLTIRNLNQKCDCPMHHKSEELVVFQLRMHYHKMSIYLITLCCYIAEFEYSKFPLGLQYMILSKLSLFLFEATPCAPQLLERGISEPCLYLSTALKHHPQLPGTSDHLTQTITAKAIWFLMRSVWNDGEEICTMHILRPHCEHLAGCLYVCMSLSVMNESPTMMGYSPVMFCGFSSLTEKQKFLVNLVQTSPLLWREIPLWNVISEHWTM